MPLKRITIAIEYEQLEPLLTAYLTPAERVVNKFGLANTILHESAVHGFSSSSGLALDLPVGIN
jgi:hypothetical protein